MESPIKTESELFVEKTNLSGELKPCPFCGEKAQMDYKYDEELKCDMYFVECGFCTGSVGFFSSPIDAIKDWNRREEKCQ